MWEKCQLLAQGLSLLSEHDVCGERSTNMLSAPVAEAHEIEAMEKALTRSE